MRAISISGSLEYSTRFAKTTVHRVPKAWTVRRARKHKELVVIDGCGIYSSIMGNHPERIHSGLMISDVPKTHNRVAIPKGV